MGSKKDIFQALQAKLYQKLRFEPKESWENELNRFIRNHPKYRRVLRLE